MSLSFRNVSKTDYSLNFDIDNESWAVKRRQLTSEFGSARKKKMQEAAKRRHVHDVSFTFKSTFKCS